jgi:uncharacterized membrane protein
VIRLTRIVGFLLIVAGALVILTWLVEPLRELWPRLRQLPWPIQLGLALAAIGFLILLGSLIWERIEERENDRSLREDE